MSVTATGTAPVAQVLQQLRSLASPDTRPASAAITGRPWRVARALQQVGDAVDAATLLATEVFDAHGDGEILRGAASTQAWIRTKCRISAQAASERVRLARASRTMISEPLESRRGLAHLRAPACHRSVYPTSRSEPQTATVHLLTELAEVASVSTFESRVVTWRKSSTPTARWATPSASSTAATSLWPR